MKINIKSIKTWVLIYLLVNSFCLWTSQRVTAFADVVESKKSATGWKTTFSILLEFDCCRIRTHSAVEEHITNPIFHSLTVESCDPVANKPSSNGEKSKSVTKSEWQCKRGSLFDFLPVSFNDTTYKFDPDTSALKAAKAADALMTWPLTWYDPIFKSLSHSSGFGVLGAAFLYFEALNRQDISVWTNWKFCSKSVEFLDRFHLWRILVGVLGVFTSFSLYFVTYLTFLVEITILCSKQRWKTKLQTLNRPSWTEK